jgi:hypothetical protein
MGLINLLTNPKNFKFYNGGQGYTGNGTQPSLTNIPYGKDRIDGGSSGQPYIQIPIPDNVSNLGLANNDFVLRGGALSVENAATDVLRLTKMFGDLKSPSGLLFIAKQQLLSRTAVRTQTSGFLNAGVYNPLGTLAQAGVVNIGGHFNKQGNIFAETGAYSTNDALYGVKITPAQPSAKNRLVQIYNTKQVSKTLSDNVISYPGGPGSTLGIGNTNIRFTTQRTGENNEYFTSNPSWWYGYIKDPITNQRFPSKQINPGKYLKYLFSTDKKDPTAVIYDQGASGKYVRLTRLINGEENYINNYFNTEGKQFGVYDHSVYESAFEGNTWPKNSPLINDNGTYVYNQLDLINKTPIKGTYNTTQDFRAVLRNTINQSITTTDATNTGQLAHSLDYNIGANKTIEGRVNLGNPGNRSDKVYANYGNGITRAIFGGSIYNTIDPSTIGINPAGTPPSIEQLGLDRINSLPVYRSEAASTDNIVNDLVKFRIAVIDNDKPGFKTFIHFRAFLDSISDSYNADWNPVQYLGRGEKFYNYNGFTRQISLSWTVAAQSKEELIPMYKKLNYLASSLAPNYSGNGYMRGNMTQLTIGGYIFEQPGIITGLTYTMEETSPWEIGINSDYNAGGGTKQGDPSVKELAHIIRVTGFNFIPIHRFRPEVQDPGKQNDYKQFIALANGSGPLDNNYGTVPPLLPNSVKVNSFKSVPAEEKASLKVDIPTQPRGQINGNLR